MVQSPQSREQATLIGELARRAGVSRDTVRLYTRLGLVPCQSRQAGSRLYADYDESAVTLIKGIKTAQSIGFTLAELGPIAAAYRAGSLDDSRQRQLLAAKLDQIDDKRRQLDQLSESLHGKLDDPGTSAAPRLTRLHDTAPHPRNRERACGHAAREPWGQVGRPRSPAPDLSVPALRQ